MSTLSPGQWQEISPYLDHVLSLPEEEREGWLQSFRLEKPGLAEVLQQLLEEHRALAGEHFLERMPIRVANGVSLLDKKIGAYTLISLIGQGGMGSVWLAERSDGRFEVRTLDNESLEGRAATPCTRHPLGTPLRRKEWITGRPSLAIM